jgi:hypothetical protein
MFCNFINPVYIRQVIIFQSLQFYSGRKITPSLGYVTVIGEGKMERARGSKIAKSLSEHVYFYKKHFSPYNFDTIGGILIH